MTTTKGVSICCDVCGMPIRRGPRPGPADLPEVCPSCAAGHDDRRTKLAAHLIVGGVVRVDTTTTATPASFFFALADVSVGAPDHAIVLGPGRMVVVLAYEVWTLVDTLLAQDDARLADAVVLLRASGDEVLR